MVETGSSFLRRFLFSMSFWSKVCHLTTSGPWSCTYCGLASTMTLLENDEIQGVELISFGRQNSKSFLDKHLLK